MIRDALFSFCVCACTETRQNPLGRKMVGDLWLVVLLMTVACFQLAQPAVAHVSSKDRQPSDDGSHRGAYLAKRSIQTEALPRYLGGHDGEYSIYELTYPVAVADAGSVRFPVVTLKLSARISNRDFFGLNIVLL